MNRSVWRTTVTACCAAGVLYSCVPGSAVREFPAEHLLVMDGDSLAGRIVGGDILALNVQTTVGDTVEVDNASIERIEHIRTGRDITDRYIDRKAIKLELAKRAALEQKARRQREARSSAAGRRSTNRHEPFAILFADLETGEKDIPALQLSILNLSEKTMESFRLKVHCFDRHGTPVTGAGGRDNVFQATSRIPIDPEEDFTTTLHLRSHPKTQKARVEIYLVDFADKSRWIGIVSADAN